MKILLVIVGAAAASSAGCGGSPQLTESQEYFVGRGVAAGSIFGGNLVTDSPALEEYVANVGYTVALESDRPETFKGYTFGVLKSDAINAFAAPGGFVFVTTAALRLMESEDELAGVLAHEIAHVNLRHPELAAQRASQKQGAFDILGGAASFLSMFKIGPPAAQRRLEQAKQLAGVFTKVLEDIAQEIVNGYGREDELAADTLAVDLVSRAGAKYDPGALKAFIARLPQRDRGAWSTHPTLEGRGKNIDDEMQRRGITGGTDPARTRRFKAMTAGLRGP